MEGITVCDGRWARVGWLVDGKSGLTHEHLPGIERSEHDTPRVSPYRLTAHLSWLLQRMGFDVDRNEFAYRSP